MPGDVATAIAALPLTHRRDLVRDQLDHPPLGLRRCGDGAPPTRVGITGSADTLLVLAWSPGDLEREIAAGARLLRRLGVAPAVRVANTLPGALATPGALLVGDVVEHLGALDVPLGVVDGEAAARQAWQLVDLVEPAVLIVDVASAGPLFAAAGDSRRSWWRGIVWLHASGAPPPVPAAFDGWQRAWLAVPEASCFVAWSCSADRFHPDDGVALDVVDGALVVTPLDAGVPLLRYASGIAARRCSTPCACGEPGFTFELETTTDDHR